MNLFAPVAHPISYNHYVITTVGSHLGSREFEYLGVSGVFSPLRHILRRGEVDCKEVRRLSSDYLTEELRSSKLSAIQAHLNNCGPCRAFIDTLGSTIGILSRIPRVSPGPSFKQSVLDRLKRGS